MHSSLERRIEALGPWFHNLELDGIETAPDHFLGDFPAVKWHQFAHALPDDLRGRTVLDIGCNAGFYSLEMKRRGAQRVVGVDSDQRYLDQARLASKVLGIEIEFRQMSVYDVASLGEQFDVILFMGVLYHLRPPLLALDLIREHVARDMMVFQSLQRGSDRVADLADNYPFSETAIFADEGIPRLNFIEQSFADDSTNWWIPNRACTEVMLRSAGFIIEQRATNDVYICRINSRAVPRCL
jgi:tRNA (mo5U34)-methyltransferase